MFEGFKEWIVSENLWSLQKFLVLWAVVCCVYGSAKIAAKVSEKVSGNLGWFVGQIFLVCSIAVCFLGAMAFTIQK